MFISPELKTEQAQYHQTMLETPALRHYWPHILKYALFDNALLFILFMSPIFILTSYSYLRFLLPIPATVLFSYLTALLTHTTNGYALPPRSDQLLGGFFVKLGLIIGGKIKNKNKQGVVRYTSFSYFNASLVAPLMYICSRAARSIEADDTVKRLGKKVDSTAILQVIFIVCSIVGLVWCQYHLPTIAFALSLFIWLILLPACLIQIAIDHSVLAGLKIKAIRSFIRKMDNEYIWVALAMVATAGWFYLTLFHFSSIFFLLGLFISLYSFITCFHLFGYLVYHRRHIIDYYAENTLEQQAEQLADKYYAQADAIVQQAKVHVTERGLLKHAFSILILHLSTANDDLQLHAEVSRLLFEWEDKRLALRHAAVYVHLLISQQKYVTAYSILQKCDAQDFILSDPDDYLPLIDYYFAVDNSLNWVLDLIHQYEQHYPQHEDLYAIQLIKVQLLCEHAPSKSEIKTTLRHLLAQPKHPLHKKAIQLAHKVNQTLL